MVPKIKFCMILTRHYYRFFLPIWDPCLKKNVVLESLIKIDHYKKLHTYVIPKQSK
jgi:hypothetical protein